jgi:hypothetical protein
VSTRTLYSPSYSQKTGRNKYHVTGTWVTAPEAFKKCFGMRMSRVMPKPGGEFEVLLKKMVLPWVWVRKRKILVFVLLLEFFMFFILIFHQIGAKRNNGDGKFYWDDGREFDQELRTSDSGDCVELINDNTYMFYRTAACSNYYAQGVCIS